MKRAAARADWKAAEKELDSVVCWAVWMVDWLAGKDWKSVVGMASLQAAKRGSVKGVWLAGQRVALRVEC